MRTLNVFISVFSLLTAGSSMAQNSFSIAPEAGSAIQFKLSDLKRTRAEVSPRLLKLLTDNKSKGALFGGTNANTAYEIAFLASPVSTRMYQPLAQDEIETIVCHLFNPVGIYLLNPPTIGFKVPSRDTDLHFKDEEGQHCFLKAGPQLLKLLAFTSGQTEMVINRITE
ncbi:MAG: hypothetical protein H7333_10605 [Bdellovibrionales bacterium]|nr:hypothetical protein [Oligoflexia bacterium]